MAIRANASGEALQRTSIPTLSPISLMGWFVRSATRSGDQTTLGAYDSAGFNGGEFEIYFSGTGTQLRLYLNGDPNARLMGSYSTGSWFFVAMTMNGTGAGSVLVYDAAAGANTLTAYSSVSRTAVGSNNRLNILNNLLYDDWLDGRAAAVKIYTQVLTQAELELEMMQYRPHRTADLYSWMPLVEGTAGTDYSGAGNSFTAAGTLAQEDGPPIPWGPSRRRIFIPAAAGGGINRSASFLSSGAALYTATATKGSVSKSASFLSSGAQLFSASATSAPLSRSAALLSSGAQLFSASVAGTQQDRTAAFLSSGAQLFSATATKGSVSRSASFLSSGAQLFAATSSSATLSRSASLLSSGAQLFSASASSAALSRSAALLASGAQLFSATRSSAALSRTAAFLSSGAQVFSASVPGLGATLFAHWSMDDTRVGVIGGRYPLTTVGQPPIIRPGRIGAARRFVRVPGSFAPAQYATGPADADARSMALGSWSFACWWKSTGTPFTNDQLQLFIRLAGTGPDETEAGNMLLSVHYTTNTRQVTVSWEEVAAANVSFRTTAAFPAAVAWHHIGAVKRLQGNGTALVDVYFDGTLVETSSPLPNAVGGGNASWWLGIHQSVSTGLPFLALDGDLDDVRIYQGELTAAEMRELATIPARRVALANNGRSAARLAGASTRATLANSGATSVELDNE